MQRDIRSKLQQSMGGFVIRIDRSVLQRVGYKGYVRIEV